MPRPGTVVVAGPVEHYLAYPTCALTQAAARMRERARVVELIGAAASPEGLRRAVEAEDPALVVATGHGLECAFTLECTELALAAPTGRYPECAVEVGAELVRGRVLHLISCRTATELGPWAVENGALALIGYSDDVLFFVGAPPCARSTVAAFVPDSEAAVALAFGATVAEAEAVRRAAYEEEVAYWTVGGGSADPNAPLIARLLRHNARAAKVVGDLGARTAPPGGVPVARPRPLLAVLLASLPLVSVTASE